ncbi:MAG: hypothetical protein LBC47_06550 [Tannerella sp.]|jgi:hypothetical protein|nr:hypothetical protein [Tannerella sp.]
MPLWLIFLLFTAIVAAIIWLPSKGKLRIVKIGLIVLAALALAYIAAVFILLGGIE